MCRTVRDAAILLSVLTGVDPDDSATAASAGKTQPDYAQFCDPNGLKGAHIGVARKYFGFSDAVDALMEQALDVIRKQGAILVDPADLDTHGKFDETEATVLLYELKTDLHAYLARLGPSAPVRTLKDVIDFNDRNREKEMPYFGQDLFLKAQSKGALTDKEYLDALAKNHQLAGQGRHRRSHGQESSGCDCRSYRRSGVANRSCHGRSLLGREFQCRCSGGLSEHQCDRRFYFWACRLVSHFLAAPGASPR